MSDVPAARDNDATTGDDATVPPALKWGRLPTAPAVTTVLTEILKRGPIPRIEVARRAGLSQTAVTKAVARLAEHGLISAHDHRRSSAPGRPVQPLSVHEEAALAIGITVRVDAIFGVVTTLRADVRHSIHRPLPSTVPAAVADSVATVIDLLLAELGPDAERVLGAGVAVSGEVDSELGIVRNSPRLNWTDVPLRDLVRERRDLPVLVDNDVRALSVAEEWFGIGVDANSFAILTIGAGIGCGLYVNGDIVTGDHGVAGEIGHLPLGPSDLLCTCGRHGCVETVASTSAIVHAIRTARQDPLLTMREAVALARGGDEVARGAFERAGSVLGLALATVANLVGPSSILVAGESVANYDLFDLRLREAFEAHVFGSAGACTIVAKSHTFEDWARGSAASAIQALVKGKLAAQS
ncbi:ROK family transcriptional regulator [Streptomyces sp. NPDC051954]|uniref:ROK family transcriptional regulator n=1 Tax=unclassified Streptomyces TaxID=2593676 RepID=UPI00342996E5